MTINLSVFYLNLARRTDRNEHCIKEIDKAGFKNITRIEAIDATTHVFSEKELSYFKNADFLNKDFTIGIMCNFLGHMMMWKKIIDDDLDYAIICQDDVYFVNGVMADIDNILKNMPNDTEIVEIGFHELASGSYFVPYNIHSQSSFMTFMRLYDSSVNGYIGKLRRNVNPCSLCYILTKKGAKELLEHTEKNGVIRATDGHINDFFNNKGNHYGSLKVLATGEPSFGSDIFS
jgi:GR25 family glycosyltransferase involved in LPS biosynthesis